jgi:hypothetical protein
MLNKGLCISCGNEKTCIFAKHLPVLECEEFDLSETKKVSGKKKQA